MDDSMICILSIGILLSFLLALGFLLVSFLTLTVRDLRLRAVSIGLFVGFVTAVLASNYLEFSLPFVRVFVLPVIVSAITIAIFCTKEDWHSLKRNELPEEILSQFPRDLFAFLSGLLGATLGAVSWIGKPVLRGMGEDVIGIMQGEIIAIRVAGGIVGFFAGSFLFFYIWSAICKFRK